MKNRNELFIVLVVIGIVVIAVIAAISGMLQPALNQAHAKQCVSNLSQIGKGFFQYAMSYDDWYPTVRKYKTKRVSEPRTFGEGFYERDIPVDGGKWLGSDSYKAFTLLRDQDLLTDPKVFRCPGKSSISPAQRYTSLHGHVSYNWCDGLEGRESTLSPVSADGADNHGKVGFFVRGDGSVGRAEGSRSVKWYQTDIIKDFCKSPNDLPNYSF